MASGNLLINLGGGLPIRFGGVDVEAIGVGGGTVEQDIAIAKLALSAISADPID
ncbi:heme-binding protein [Nostoc sp.]|uniref:heme-binding protein n=1 Tax=Nostoc sp. TaxID=1180 RepID=UPI002FFB6E27